MADKFTRLATVEGDIFYATTASSSKSIESLEDNIDAKLFAHIGVDSVGGSIASSTTETKIGEVIVSANSANSRMSIIAGVRYADRASGTGGSAGNLRIRTGTSATATSNTQRAIIVLQHDIGSGVSGGGISGGVLLATITTSDETFTGQIYVHVTGENGQNNSNTVSYCDYVLVFGA